jgi:ABC-type Fe3+/spermidine/putrescine transport system ATPase subunit
MARKSKTEVASTANEMLERVQLSDLRDRKAHELSGGQQQRVALARALAVRPKVLLLDEPLANLDANLRVDMREQIRDVQIEMGITAIFVTHDQEEAVMLADRVALMKEGRLLQVGAPEDFYQRPATATVSSFFRNTNLLEGVLAGNRVNTNVGELTVNADHLEVPDGDVLITVRPEAVEVGPGVNSIDGLVKTAIYMGTHTHLQIDIDGKVWDVHSRVDDRIAVGDQIKIRLPPDGIWALPVSAPEAMLTPEPAE